MNWGTSGFVEIGGTRLECSSFGSKDGPVIVMLHEGLGCVALWRDLPERLAEATGFGVLAYSRAGYGASDPVSLPRPLDYMTQDADVLGDVLDAFDLRDVVLLGHSDGATIAAIYAGSKPDMRVRGAVLIAPHFFTEPMGLAAIEKARDAYLSGDLKDKLGKYHADVDVTFWGWNRAWLDPAFKDWNVTEVIDYLRIPTLAIQGTEDPYGTAAQIEVLETGSYAPVDTVWLGGCGHAPHQDAPEQTLAAITEFCARLQRIERAVVAL